MDLIATTAFGLEAVTRRELAELGYTGQVIAPGWIRFSGDLSALCRTNLWLRTADRVLVQVATFPAEDFDTLFETTKAIAWREWLPADAALPVAGRSIKSQLSSVPACQRTVKKAIVESLRHAYGTSDLPETGAVHKIEVAILKNQVTLTLDTTGPSLHKRSYRQANVRAPLKETLAAAMVLLSFWDSQRPLIDPFCGSGTIPIEAAWIARCIAPGVNRSFAAEAWPNVATALWHEARSEARDKDAARVPRTVAGHRHSGAAARVGPAQCRTSGSRRSAALSTSSVPGIDEQTHTRLRDHQPARRTRAKRLADTRAALSTDSRGAAQAAHMVAFHPDRLSAF